MIAYLFKIDPIDVLNSDRIEWEIRLAAAKYVENAVEKANKKKK